MTAEAIVLVSGGMDSLVCAAIAVKKYPGKVAFLHMSYGQKTSKKEKECFQKIADFYQIPQSLRKTIDMSFLSQIGGSSLTDQNISVSKFDGDKNIIPSSYVPFRNTIILSLAVSWAEVMHAHQVFIGANDEDSPGYPDCRPSYYSAFNRLIQEGTKEQNISVLTPVISMRKSEIVKTGLELNVPFELSWSCYAREDKACGVCDSCALRLRGFKEAGASDPLEYV